MSRSLGIAGNGSLLVAVLNGRRAGLRRTQLLGHELVILIEALQSIVRYSQLKKVEVTMQNKSHLSIFIILVWGLLGVTPMVAAQWGTLSGTIVYDGTVVDPLPVKVNKDVEVCGKHNLKIETLVVDPDTRGIANCIVYVYLKKKEEIDVHPSYETSATEKITFDNQNCRFEPRVVLVRTGQTLVIGNKDPVGHNTKVDSPTHRLTRLFPPVELSNGCMKNRKGARSRSDVTSIPG